MEDPEQQLFFFQDIAYIRENSRYLTYNLGMKELSLVYKGDLWEVSFI